MKLWWFVVEIVLDRLGRVRHTGSYMSDEPDKKLDEKLDRFGAGLFKYLDQRFDEMGSRIDQLHRQVSSLEGAVDTVLKNQETDRLERLAANRQLDRHEGWIHQLARRIGIKLSYDTRG